MLWLRPTAAICDRISKDHDGKLGVDRQEKLCRTLAKNAGLSASTVLVDNDLSACAPRLSKQVTVLGKDSVDAVATYHADRLDRRTTDLERLVTVVETPPSALL